MPIRSVSWTSCPATAAAQDTLHIFLQRTQISLAKTDPPDCSLRLILLRNFAAGVNIHDPSTVNNVSAYTTGSWIDPGVPSRGPEIIPKDIRLSAALRKVSRLHHYLNVRQNLIYSSYGARGWEYDVAPKCDCSKRQWSKDY
jgi:hypothetical protein